jgi:thiamine-phosphate pyrophosphorylase
VDLIQVREKDLSARELLSLARSARDLKRGHETKILVNDRLDVAVAADLDGIHLGQSSVPIQQIHGSLSRRDLLVGVSTHSLEEAGAAQKYGASFVTFGPVFFTPSKAKYGNPAGLESLKKVCQLASIPVFALGGVDQSNYRDCLLHGASGVAAIRLFQDPGIPILKIAREIRRFQDRIE